MISDATEAAARAYSRTEDPTASGLKNVVETVVTEKVDDGQLDESQLTFGDLTRIKAELVRALMGYYHARVPYPGFPGPKREGNDVTECRMPLPRLFIATALLIKSNLILISLKPKKSSFRSTVSSSSPKYHFPVEIVSYFFS